MAFEYGQPNRWVDQYFAAGKTLPSTTNDTTDALGVGAHQASLTVILTAKTACSIPATKTLTVTVQDSDDGTTFADVAGAPELLLSGGTSTSTDYAAGTQMAQMVLPECKRYARLKLTSSGASTGTVDVTMGYMAR